MMTLLYIGCDFHMKTRSSAFLLSLLEKQFHITQCHVDLYGDNPYSAFQNLPQSDFDVLVCFQVMPPRTILDTYVRYKHAVFFPMLDGCPSVWKTEKWFPYRDFQIISFSRTLGRQLVKAGFSVKTIQFFPKPADNPERGDAEAAFFWFRRNRINAPLVEQLISKSGVCKIHIHNAPDPGSRFVFPSQDGLIAFTYSTWHEDKATMTENIASCAYYFAPRPREGIGMSFLEAMAMGKCVVAPNEPTMNEYIEHGRTGLLYNLRKPRPLPAVDVRQIQENAYRFMCEGYRQWENDKHDICNWMLETVSVSRPRMALYLGRRFLRNPAKVVRALKSEARRRRT